MLLLISRGLSHCGANDEKLRERPQSPFACLFKDEPVIITITALHDDAIPWRGFILIVWSMCDGPITQHIKEDSQTLEIF